MIQYSVEPDRSQLPVFRPRVPASVWSLSVLLVAAPVPGIAPRDALAAPPSEPFKIAAIHIETNASACDMGIQIFFDTEGITSGFVESPGGRRIYQFSAKGSMKETGGQSEGFLEGLEPQITELLDEFDCEPGDEGVSSLDDFLDAFPEGDYTFKGGKPGAKFESIAALNHKIPAGPEIVAPAAGTGGLNPNANLTIDWNAVTGPIIPELGPIDPADIVGYHVIVVDTATEPAPELDVDVPSDVTDFLVPAQYLLPNKVYQVEVLATEDGGNQTISEDFFCTAPIATVDCELP